MSFSTDMTLTTNRIAFSLYLTSGELRILHNIKASVPDHTTAMSSLRLSRAALRARPTTLINTVQRRGYADAVSDKIKLSLALPHQVRDYWRELFCTEQML